MNEPLHPQTSNPRTEVLSPVEAVDRFAHEISRPDFVTRDYGDWMRRVNVELKHLALLLDGESEAVRARLVRMQDFIQLEPDWNLMSTLRRTVREVIALRTELGAKDSKTLADYGVSVSEEDPTFANPEHATTQEISKMNATSSSLSSKTLTLTVLLAVATSLAPSTGSAQAAGGGGAGGGGAGISGGAQGGISGGAQGGITGGSAVGPSMGVSPNTSIGTTTLPTSQSTIGTGSTMSSGSMGSPATNVDTGMTQGTVSGTTSAPANGKADGAAAMHGNRRIVPPPGTRPTDPAPTAPASTTSGTPTPASTAPTSVVPMPGSTPSR